MLVYQRVTIYPSSMKWGLREISQEPPALARENPCFPGQASPRGARATVVMPSAAALAAPVGRQTVVGTRASMWGHLGGEIHGIAWPPCNLYGKSMETIYIYIYIFLENLRAIYGNLWNIIQEEQSFYAS